VLDAYGKRTVSLSSRYRHPPARSLFARLLSHTPRQLRWAVASRIMCLRVRAAGRLAELHGDSIAAIRVCAAEGVLPGVPRDFQHQHCVASNNDHSYAYSLAAGLLFQSFV
jgi:hypothetical protein